MDILHLEVCESLVDIGHGVADVLVDIDLLFDILLLLLVGMLVVFLLFILLDFCKR